jgi:hypothetical protein
MVQLRDRISAWRLDIAAKQRMAPAAVLAEHLVVKIAYAGSRGPLSGDALRGVGVRAAPVQELEMLIATWCNEHQVGVEMKPVGGGSPMINLSKSFCATMPWAHTVYVPGKPWEASAERFSSGEALAAIAINQGMTKAGAAKAAILPATVAGHLLNAIPFARHSLDLARLAADYHPPNSTEWTQMQQTERQQKLDVTTFGAAEKEILSCVCPSCGVPYAERSEEQKSDCQRWGRLTAWFFAFRRVGYEPTFCNSTSSARVLPTSLAPPSGSWVLGEHENAEIDRKRYRFE